ncbi:hypothetical protein IWQ61_003504 [Dispira simplex]|nr:hypothetical protein IWQ61_003504 [Dispira simplex]
MSLWSYADSFAVSTPLLWLIAVPLLLVGFFWGPRCVGVLAYRLNLVHNVLPFRTHDTNFQKPRRLRLLITSLYPPFIVTKDAIGPYYDSHWKSCLLSRSQVTHNNTLESSQIPLPTSSPVDVHNPIRSQSASFQTDMSNSQYSEGQISRETPLAHSFLSSTLACITQQISPTRVSKSPVDVATFPSVSPTSTSPARATPVDRSGNKCHFQEQNPRRNLKSHSPQVNARMKKKLPTKPRTSPKPIPLAKVQVSISSASIIQPAVLPSCAPGDSHQSDDVSLLDTTNTITTGSSPTTHLTESSLQLSPEVLPLVALTPNRPGPIRRPRNNTVTKAKPDSPRLRRQWFSPFNPHWKVSLDFLKAQRSFQRPPPGFSSVPAGRPRSMLIPNTLFDSGWIPASAWTSTSPPMGISHQRAVSDTFATHFEPTPMSNLAGNFLPDPSPGVSASHPTFTCGPGPLKYSQPLTSTPLFPVEWPPTNMAVALEKNLAVARPRHRPWSMHVDSEPLPSAFHVSRNAKVQLLM